MITMKDYKGALSRLSDLKDKIKGSMGENAKNDRIKDSTAQKNIAKILTTYLPNQNIIKKFGTFSLSPYQGKSHLGD